MTTALTRLKPVWNDRSISLSSKIRLMQSLVTSIFLYACEPWTLTAELKEEYKSWKWGATARYYAYHLKTMLPSRKSVPRSSRQSYRRTRQTPGQRKETQTEVVWTCLPSNRFGQNRIARHWKGEEDKADRRRDGKTTSRNGQAWSSPSPRGR